MNNHIHKIMLIVPAATISSEYSKEIQPPLGLAYIAACLEKDYQVKILDAACEGWYEERKETNGFLTYGLDYTQISKRIQDFNPDVVGVSCLFSMQHKNAHRVCQVAKKTNINIITIMGGAHPSVLAEETLKDDSVDFVVIGEGEQSTKELLDSLRDNKDVSSIDGIAFKVNNKILINPKTKFIEDLDSLPLPARHLLPMDKYFKINLPHGISSRYRPNTPVVTSRGCPANCIFCSIHSIWGYTFRGRRAENIIQELEFIKDTYDIKEIQFEDDNLTFDKTRAMRLFQLMVDKKIGLAWTTPNGVSLWNLDKDLLSKMKEAGCYRLCLAIESGDQKLLSETIKKPLRLQKVLELMRWIKYYGFETDAFFVVGFPDETKGQLKNTFEFASKLNTDNTTFYLATPYPGTELFKICSREGWLDKDFSLSNLGVKKANIYTKYFSRNELEKIVAYQTLKLKISLLWRNPKAFYRKVLKRFFKTPGQFISLVNKLVEKTFSR
ncbi:MAG: radical SAM protein [Candidatus Omnitrophota bacterium]